MSVLEWIQAIVLGLVQGLTEFLPISSSGHVLLVPALLKWEDPGAGFTAVIQLGTILAVLIYFREDLKRTLKGWGASLVDPSQRGTPESKLGWAIAVGTIPISVVGLLFEDQIDNALRSPVVVATTLILLALVLALAERVGKRERGLDDVRITDGLWVGLWQAIALIPGSSRSGSTITGALFLGFDRTTAARFSFLLSVPAVLASGLYKLYSERSTLLDDGLLFTIVASIASFISGYWAIAFLIKFLQSRSTMVFVWYRIVLGIVIFGLIWRGFFAEAAL